jgi:hypothetical protein
MMLVTKEELTGIDLANNLIWTYHWNNTNIFYDIIKKKKTKKNLCGSGPLANYADRATAACWRSSANFCG